ncbi:hypothetical protein [Pasteuria penetrans]|uniref:hypothetical protein n=1 Tax=Pasteuria penetrans TaxID=86005 RepID=UPI000F981131|nr:hypothetical protein [Pasteuria penetrans]
MKLFGWNGKIVKSVACVMLPTTFLFSPISHTEAAEPSAFWGRVMQMVAMELVPKVLMSPTPCRNSDGSLC